MRAGRGEPLVDFASAARATPRSSGSASAGGCGWSPGGTVGGGAAELETYRDRRQKSPTLDKDSREEGPARRVGAEVRP